MNRALESWGSSWPRMGRFGWLANPMTNVHIFGRPVAGLAKLYDGSAGRAIVMRDEVDISHVALRLEIGGGEGRRDGSQDMSDASSAEVYHRVRVGVGRPLRRRGATAYMLKHWPSIEAQKLTFLFDDAAAVGHPIAHGRPEAQQKPHAQ